MDSRLEHLLKLEAEARLAVQCYVARRWPVGARVAYTFNAKRVVGTVVGSDVGAGTITVDGDDRSRRRIPYARIITRKC